MVIGLQDHIDSKQRSTRLFSCQSGHSSYFHTYLPLKVNLSSLLFSLPTHLDTLYPLIWFSFLVLVPLDLAIPSHKPWRVVTH